MAYLPGDGCSITNPTGAAFKADAFAVTITQGTAEAVAFGESWVTTRGTVKRASLTMSGFTVSGAASAGLALMVQGSAAWVGTYSASHTLGGNIVFDSLGMAAALESYVRQTESAKFDGAITETWS